MTGLPICRIPSEPPAHDPRFIEYFGAIEPSRPLSAGQCLNDALQDYRWRRSVQMSASPWRINAAITGCTHWFEDVDIVPELEAWAEAALDHADWFNPMQVAEFEAALTALGDVRQQRRLDSDYAP